VNKSIIQVNTKNIHQKKAAFFDRDGVINIDRGYVGNWSEFEFVNGIFDVLKYVAASNFLIFIVTNQSGIARGYYSELDFHDVTGKMLDELKVNNISVEKVYFCPHHEDFGNKVYKKNCSCRKPNPGMINKAALDFDLDLDRSILIGDKVSDISAANAAGIGKSFLLNDRIEKDFNNAIICRNISSLLKSIENETKNSN
jgi:D-glycero-D-manno-heptose 1,7-bisphosphate phosphatase